MGAKVRLKGKVIWYDIVLPEETPYHFRAGVYAARWVCEPRWFGTA